MRTEKNYIYGFVLLMVVGIVAEASAQDFTIIRDFYGEIKDADHPAGYRDYVEMGCYQCHGFQGQGADNVALFPLMPYEGFAHQTRTPRGTMPAYSPNVLTDAQLRRIHGYLQSLPPSPDVSEIPLLSPE